MVSASIEKKKKDYEEDGRAPNQRLDQRIAELRLLLEMLREAIKLPNNFTKLDDLKCTAKELRETVEPLMRDERIDSSDFLERLQLMEMSEKTPATFLRVEENLEVKGKTIGGLDPTKQELAQVEIVVKENREAPKDLKKAESEIKDVPKNIEKNLEELRKSNEGFYSLVEKLDALRALEDIKELSESLSWRSFHDLSQRYFGDGPRDVKNNFAFVA